MMASMPTTISFYINDVEWAEEFLENNYNGIVEKPREIKLIL